jgi:hypothetical protein
LVFLLIIHTFCIVFEDNIITPPSFHFEVGLRLGWSAKLRRGIPLRMFSIDPLFLLFVHVPSWSAFFQFCKKSFSVIIFILLFKIVTFLMLKDRLNQGCQQESLTLKRKLNVLGLDDPYFFFSRSSSLSFSLFQLSTEIMIINLFGDILSSLYLSLCEREGLCLNTAFRVGSNHLFLFLSHLLQVQKLAWLLLSFIFG